MYANVYILAKFKQLLDNFQAMKVFKVVNVACKMGISTYLNDLDSI